MDNYVVQRVVELQRAIEKLKVSMALTKTSVYTMDYIRDQLEADPTFYAWIVSSLQSDVAFYNWFRDALEVDASFISSLVNSFSLDLAANNWVRNTATYSTESFITLTRTTTQSFAAGVLTNIQWQAVTRNSNSSAQFQTPFSFPGVSPNVVIPQSGYYNISLSGSVDVVSTKRIFLAINGNAFVINVNDNQPSSARLYASMTAYLNTGDVILLQIIFNVAVVMSVVAENATNQSPILHIVKINAAG